MRGLSAKASRGSRLAARSAGNTLTTEAALAELEKLLLADHAPAVTLAALDWRRLKAALPSLAAPRFAGIAGQNEAGAVYRYAGAVTLVGAHRDRPALSARGHFRPARSG